MKCKNKTLVLILNLTAVLSIGIMAESRAGETLSPTGSCGEGCRYEIIQYTDGTQDLRVYNDPNYTGTSKTIKSSAFQGSGTNVRGDYEEHYTNASFNKITIDGDFDKIGNDAFRLTNAKEVVFNGNVKNIGYAAFEYNNLTSVNLPEGLQSIEGEAFFYNKISSLVIPDSVTSIGNWTFSEKNSTLTSVYMPDTLDNLGQSYPFGQNQNLSIICKGDVEKCQSLVKEYKLSSDTIHDYSNRVTGATKEQCTGEKYFWNGESCSRKEAYCGNNMYYTGFECLMRPENDEDIVCDYQLSGYVKMGNNCVAPENSYAKKHYTPAEANRWLKDKDNTITLIFKK